MKTVKKKQQAKSKSNTLNSPTSKLPSDGEVCSPKPDQSPKKQSKRVHIPSLHLILVPFDDQHLLGLHYQDDIWIIQSELSRILGIDKTYNWDEIPDECRATIVVPGIFSGLYDLSLVTLQGLQTFLKDTENIINSNHGFTGG